MAESAPETKPIENKESMKRRILMADDDKGVITSLTWLLELEGYMVDAVENGQLLWDKLEKEKYDLVITDNNMPVLSGVEVLKKIRGDARFNKLPVIVNSGDDGIEKTVQVFGGTLFTKGNSPSILLKKIKDLLSDSKE